LWAAPQHAADDQLARALLEARAGKTARLGHLLAPIGVRYVAVVSRPAPGHGEDEPVDPVFADALTRQLDLSVSRIDDGATIYSNDAWIPRRAVVPADTTVAATSGAGLPTAARVVAAPGTGGVVGPVHRSTPAGPGTLLWAEAASSGWHARADGRDLVRTNAFDWTNAFALPSHASVALHYRAGGLSGLLIDVEVVAWLVAIVLWRRTRVRRARHSRTMSV
jgi:hypothetical protein